MNSSASQTTLITDKESQLTNQQENVYFLVKDRQSAEQLTQTLEHQGSSKINKITAFTALDKPCDEIKGASVPSVADRTDIVNAARRGALMGILLGLLSAIVLFNLPAIAPHMSAGMIAFVTLSGLVLGMWFSTLIGISVPNPRLRELVTEFDKGRVLVLVKVKPKFRSYVRSLSRYMLGNRILAQGKL